MSTTTAPSPIRQRIRPAARPAESGWNRPAVGAVLFFVALLAIELALIYAAAPTIDLLRDVAAAGVP